MNPDFFNRLDVALAPERLDAYRQDAPGPAVTLARYLLNMAVCESLYPPLQIVEIALRNAVHRHLTTRYGTDAWYDHPNLRLLSGQSAQVTEARNKLIDANKPITPGRVVAELSFGFWTGFFNHAHSRTGLGAFLSAQVFVHAPRTERDLHRLSARWKRIRDLRNRVFHHERILHWTDLDAQHAAILETIGWMSPELHDMARALDRFTAVRRQGLGPWLARIRRHWPVAPEVLMPAASPAVLSIPTPFPVDGAESPFGGPRWGGQTIRLHADHLADLNDGRTLALDVQNEYVVFLAAGTEGAAR